MNRHRALSAWTSLACASLLLPIALSTGCKDDSSAKQPAPPATNGASNGPAPTVPAAGNDDRALFDAISAANGYHDIRTNDAGRQTLSIGFRDPGMDDAGLAKLAPLLKQSSKPVELNLNGSRVTDAGLSALKGVDNLVSLGLGDGAKVTDEGMKTVGELTKLEELYLSGDIVTDAGIAHLAKLANMRKLSAYLDKVTAASYAHVAGMTQLEELVLGSLSSKMDDEKLSRMKSMVKLKELRLAGDKITDAGMAHIKGMVGVKKVWLEADNVTKAGAANLAGLTNLEELTVLKCPGLDGDGLNALKELENLHTLELIYTDAVDAKNTAVLSNLTNLKKLRLGKVDKDGLAGVKSLAKLETLDLNYSRVEDDNLAHIAGLKSLKVLDLQQTSVTDAGMKHLAGLTGLRELRLAGNPITDEGLKPLAGLAGLETLWMSECKVTGSGFAAMKGMTGLKDFSISGNPVVDEHALALAALPGLKEVNLTGTKVSEEKAEELKKAKPALRVRDVTGNEVSLTAAEPKKRPPQEDLTSAKPDFTLTSSAFAKEFADSAADARRKYNGKVVELTGKVTRIDRNISGEPNIALEGGGMFGVMCFTAEESPWAKVVPGQTVKLKGKGTEHGEGLIYCVVTDPGKYAAIEVSAADFAKEFDADPEATGKKYKDKYVLMTGEVEAKEYNSAGAVAVKLKTPGSKVKVAVSFTAFEKELSRQIKPGKPIKVVGQYTLNFGTDEVTLYFCLPVK